MHPAMRAVVLERDRLYWARRWGLVSHWGGDDLVDSYGNRTLTNNAGATFTAGKVGNAFTLASASSQYLSRASDSDLQSSGVDCWGACWVNLSAKVFVRAIFAKYLSTGNQRQWSLDYLNTADRFRILASADGSAATERQASTLGAVSTSTWYFLMWYVDVANSLLGISGNGGAFDTTAHAGGVFAGSGGLTIGGVDYGGGVASFLDGKVDEVVFGKSPPGGIAARRFEIRDRLYRGGNGRFFPWSWPA